MGTGTPALKEMGLRKEDETAHFGGSAGLYQPKPIMKPHALVVNMVCSCKKGDPHQCNINKQHLNVDLLKSHCEEVVHIL